jgi:RNA polymerase sigma factor (sigma-70 family)
MGASASVNRLLREIEAVYRRRGADFFRLALARTGETEAARDAVQEGFAKAIRSGRSYRGRGSLDAWIARCVINAAHDIVRRRRAAGSDALGEIDGGEEGPPIESDVGIVRAAVAQLPRRQRDALFLRFYLDFDYASIADTLGIDVGTVSATLHAARAALAEHLQEVKR